MLAGHPGQAIADHPLQVGRQVRVAAGDVGDERQPRRAALAVAPARSRRRHLRHAVLTPMGAQLSCAQVDHAAWGVERPDVGIPLVGGGRVFRVRAGDLLDRCNGRRARQLGLLACGFRLERGRPADAARQVGDVEQLVGIPAHAGPHQPLAPQRAVPPVVAVAAREGRGQPVLGLPVDVIQQVRRQGCVRHQRHGYPRADGQVAAHVEPFGEGVSCVPALRLVFGRQQDGHRHRARLQDGLRCVAGILPARLVPVGPDQHGLARQGRPVGLLDRCVRAMHGRGGDNAGVDQGLGAFLALDQHDMVGFRQRWLVVERARLGRRHLATLGVPGPERLASSRRVVAVHHADQLAGGVQVVPLGRGGAQVVRGWVLALAPYRLRAGLPEQLQGLFEYPREVGGHAQARPGGNEVEDVAAVAGRAVRPQARLVAVEHHLQAVAGAAQDVADHERAASLLAGREQHAQHEFQAGEQRRADLVALGVLLASHQRDLVEVDHCAPSPGMPAAGSVSCGCSAAFASQAVSSDRR